MRLRHLWIVNLNIIRYTKNISDAEIISVLSKCMSETNLKYTIRVNHRQIISEILN